MDEKEKKYLINEIKFHIKRYFHKQISTKLEEIGILIMMKKELAKSAHANKIILLCDDLVPSDFKKVRFTNFNNTFLTHIGLVSDLDESFKPFPAKENPLFFYNDKNVKVLSWCCAKFIFDTLALKDENNTDLDSHGRFKYDATIRKQHNLLNIPFFNEVSSLIAFLASSNEYTSLALVKFSKMVKPVEIGLSHDVDLIKGNDFNSQLIRLYRFIMLKGSIRAVLENQLCPNKYHRNNIKKIIGLEKEKNLSSTFYFLNGKRGRFHARGSIKDFVSLGKEIPNEWGIGIHYNYDTFLDTTKLRNQIDELSQVASVNLQIGRAHYLRFKKNDSFENWINQGIKLDESVGFSSILGFRAGIAGVYKPWNERKKTFFDIFESPLVLMDYGNTGDENECPSLKQIDNILGHLEKIGGRFTYLFHHDVYNNPEHPNFFGFYEKFLDLIVKYKVINMPAHVLISDLENDR